MPPAFPTRLSSDLNVALYPVFQTYFRTHKPPFLAVWGRNDPFFLPAGAEAFRRDIPAAVVRFFETGHFALETHAAEIAAEIRGFLPRRSEEHTSELQSLMRNSYAVFCLKKKN